MARRLEGRRFYRCSNNGVVALVDETVFRNHQLRAELVRRLEEECEERGKLRALSREELESALQHISLAPIFTFTAMERRHRDPWFTGSLEMSLPAIRAYIEREGGRIVDEYSFYVPFSNGAEIGLHGKESQRAELRFVTTSAQLLETFGTLDFSS